MDWQPTWFSRWPHTWDGGPHDWQVGAETARARLDAGEDLVTAWSDGGRPHTVLRLLANGHLALEHALLPDRGRVHRLTAQDERRSLAVLPGATSGSPYGRDPYVLYETWTRHGASVSRHTGDIRERLYAVSGLPGPSPEQVARLRDWDPVETVAAVVAALPTWAAEAEALTWAQHVSDARDRRDAVVVRLGADERAAALLAPPPVRGLFRRRAPSDRHAMPLEVGSHDLERLLTVTGRAFRVHRGDQSRVLRSPVAGGEVELDVTVKAHPGLRLAVTGVLVRHTGAHAAWVAPGRDVVEGGELTERHVGVLPELLGLALEVFDALAAEFQEPVREGLVPVAVVPPY